LKQIYQRELGLRKKNITLCIILFTLCSSISYSRGRQFFTARTRGSAGAGVASILLNDALYLNPASLAWFEKKLVGAQYSQSNEDLEGDLKGLNLSVIDTSTAYKGGFSYEQLEEFGLERDRYSASFAKKTSRLGSFGVTYRFTQDEFDGEDDDRHQLDLGYTRILTRNITIGGVVQNLFDLDQEEARTTIGLQYKVLTGVFLIGDVGANVDDISESNSLRGAIQLKISNN